MSDVKTKVVLVCDTMNEIDDQFAIAYALGSPSLEVLAVISSQNTLVHGHNSVHIYRNEAEKIVGLCGRADLPLFIGAQFPMESIDKPVGSQAVDFLINLVRNGVKFSILGTGPATDLAAFRLLHPNESRGVPIIWAGSFPDEVTWKKYKYGELNARADIAAWRVLYSDPYDLVLLPGWPGVAKVAVESISFVAELRAKNQEITDYLALILESWCEGKVALDMDSSRRTKVLWDIVNVAYYTIPQAVVFHDLAIPEVDVAGSMYWDRITNEIPVCTDVDAQAIIEDFWRAMENLKR